MDDFTSLNKKRHRNCMRRLDESFTELSQKRGSSFFVAHWALVHACVHQIDRHAAGAKLSLLVVGKVMDAS